MYVLIDNTSKCSIYEQIYTQIKAQIISGALSEDEPLPSIRSLAKDLRISVITTKRAYEELERDGYIYTIAGKGSFVALKNTELIREDCLRKIEEHMDEIRKLSANCSLSKNDIFDMINIIWEE